MPDPAAFRDVHEKNVSFAGTQGKWALLRLFWLRARAAAIVDCNGQLQKLRPETVHLYLTHGSPLKSVHDYYFCDPTTDWALSQAPFFDAVNSYDSTSRWKSSSRSASRATTTCSRTNAT